MTATVIALSLFAAVLHATWNAFLRSGADRLWTVTVMSLAMAVVAVPLALLFPFPLPSAWPYLFLSSCLQVGYSVFLISAYRHGELGQVYPIVRGSVPLLVTLGGVVFAGDHLDFGGMIGVAFVAIGIMSLSLGRTRASTTSLLLELSTGLFIATYATVDAIGVRISGNPRSYEIWIFLIYGTLMTATFILMRGRLRLDIRSTETWAAIGGGMVSLVAYGAVIAAFALRPAGPITAQCSLCRPDWPRVPWRSVDVQTDCRLRHRRRWRHLPRCLMKKRRRAMNTSMPIGISALFAALVWSMNFVVPFVIGDYLVFDFAVFRFVISGAVGFGFLVFKWDVVCRLTRRDWLTAFWLGFICYAGYFLTVVR